MQPERAHELVGDQGDEVPVRERSERSLVSMNAGAYMCRVRFGAYSQSNSGPRGRREWVADRPQRLFGAYLPLGRVASPVGAPSAWRPAVCTTRKTRRPAHSPDSRSCSAPGPGPLHWDAAMELGAQQRCWSS